MSPRLAAIALSLAALAACATVEPEPCTSEWIDYKTTRILHKFAAQNRPLINDLRRLADREGDIDPFVAFSLARQSGRIETFATSFNEVVLPELDAALQQCGTHEEFGPAFTKFLKQEGVSDAALEWIVPFVGIVQEIRNGTPESGTNTLD